MLASTRTRVGILSIGGAIGVGIIGMLFPYFWGAFLSNVPPTQDADAFHVLWIPLTGSLILATEAALLGTGFLFVWRERSQFDGAGRNLVGLATLAFSGALVVASVTIVLRVVLGFVYAPNLRAFVILASVGLTISLGFALYWLLLGVGVAQARVAGVVALTSGAGSAISGAIARMTGADGLSAIAFAAGFLSLALWLALYLWAYEEIRLRGLPSQPGLPA